MRINSPTTHTAVCPRCQRSHEIDSADFALFGCDCYCLKCVNWNHVDFMRATGDKLGLSCLPNCPCKSTRIRGAQK